MGRTRRTGLAADYGDASPEDVAQALHAHRPGDGAQPSKPWLRLEVKRSEAGIPLVVGVTEHDEPPRPS